VPTSDQEDLFTAEPPYTFSTSWSTAFADVDADGFVDALVELVAPDDAGVAPWVQVVVRGPLQAGTSLPGDAWLTLDPHEIFLWQAELTGDDAPDLVVGSHDDFGSFTASWIVPSPFDGSVTPQATWQPVDPHWWTSEWSDANHDGTLDLVFDTVDALQITWGPYTRWAGPPDVLVSPLCGDSEVDGDWLSEFWFPGDVDDDGAPEVTVVSYAFAYHDGDCGTFTASLPMSGLIDPFGSPASYEGLIVDEVISGDWTGDGLSELQFDDDLLLSPISLSVDGVIASATIDADSAWDGYWVVDTMDLGADGVPDAMGDLDGALVVFPADPAQLTEPALPQGWELQHGDVVTTTFDQGHGWAVLAEADGTTVRRIDLGPAAPR
jgi:hypothetical protein